MKCGYTLMELLVVLAIVAVLSAITYPVVSQARSRAKQVTCLSNLRQCGVALRLYMNDNETNVPPDDQTARHLLQKMPTCCPSDTVWTKSCTQEYGQPLIGSYAYTRSVSGWSNAPYEVVSDFYSRQTSYELMVDLFHGQDGIRAPLHGETPEVYARGKYGEIDKLPERWFTLYSDGHVDVHKQGKPNYVVMSWNILLGFPVEISRDYLGY
ncbi:MAG: type II secretion system protein [Armatimonadota bacterium]